MYLLHFWKLIFYYKQALEKLALIWEFNIGLVIWVYHEIS